MKLLLDECVDQRFRRHIDAHEVFTVGYLGWKGTRNGVLLRRAADDGFDCLVTTDRGIPHQHNLASLPVAIVLLEPISDDLEDLIRLVPALLDALNALIPKTFFCVTA